MKWLVSLTLVAAAAPASAQQQPVCDQPRPRDTAPLLKAIQDDDAMASTFDVTAGSCISESAACDAQKLKCNDQLTATLQRQVTVDNGMWLRDMLLPFLSQRYPMSANIATTEVAQDVSCNSDSPSLKAAATRRRQLAQRRRDLVNEYPKWAMWAAETSKKCKADAAAAAKAQADAAAAASASANAALAAKTAEELRQENLRKAEQAAKDKLEADKKAKEAELKAQAEQQRKQQEAEAEMKRRAKEQQEEAMRREQQAKMTEAERQADAARRADEEKKRQLAEAERKRLEEEDKKKRELAAAADAKFVADREAKKAAADKKLEELRLAEDARRAQVEKQMSEVGAVDRSDERLKGSLAAQVQGGYMSFTNTNAGALLGVLIQARYGIWMTAPAKGLASGMELKVNGQFLGQIVGQGGAQYFAATPELRWFFGRFGVGASFEWRHLVTPLTTTDPVDTYALGANLAFAIVDSPTGRFIATVRWMPFLNSGTVFAAERLTAELDLGYKWFSAGVQAGTVTLRNAGAGENIGWYVGLGLGARLRF
ncbi:MAG: hypothetical protein IPJ65_41025 [Archangiaceae bacterium]|nr:hypothetical protein [Archangiaceae bacterium]